MKTRFFIGCFIACAAVLTLGSAAAGYTDDMSGANDTDFTSYNNLAVQSYRAASALPDPTALTFANISKPVGSAVYLATGVETVKAAIYSHVGTLVTQRPEDGGYMLGVFQHNIAETMTNGPLQALYCPRTGGIYTEAGGLKQAATDMVNFRFVPVITPPQGERIGYGVNIYYSLDGARFTRVPMTGFSYNYDLNVQFCYEEYSAAVPQSAKMIKVEINDAYEIPRTDGGSIQNEARYMTAIASVTLNGGNLSLGPAESSSGPLPDAAAPPVAPVPGTAQAEAYAEQKSVKTKNSGGEKEEEEEEYLDAAKTEDTAPATGSSSKFSGTITSSSNERSASSGRSSSKSVGDGVSRESSAAASTESEGREESKIYQIPVNQEVSGFNGAVIAYIIIVSAVILLIVAWPRKK